MQFGVPQGRIDIFLDKMASSPPRADQKVTKTKSVIRRQSGFYDYSISMIPNSIEVEKKNIADMTAEELFCLKRQNKLESICLKESKCISSPDDCVSSFDDLMSLATSRMEEHNLY